MNMNYCKFENTAKDLGQCVDSWMPEDDEELCDTEQYGKDTIIELAIQLLEMEGYNVEKDND